MSDKDPHWYLDDSKPSLRMWIFSQMAMGAIYAMLVFFGVILLIGIVVNNGIVMVNHVNALRRRGRERVEALIEGLL